MSYDTKTALVFAGLLAGVTGLMATKAHMNGNHTVSKGSSGSKDDSKGKVDTGSGNLEWTVDKEAVKLRPSGTDTEWCEFLWTNYPDKPSTTLRAKYVQKLVLPTRMCRFQDAIDKTASVIGVDPVILATVGYGEEWGYHWDDKKKYGVKENSYSFCSAKGLMQHVGTAYYSNIWDVWKVVRAQKTGKNVSQRHQKPYDVAVELFGKEGEELLKHFIAPFPEDMQKEALSDTWDNGVKGWKKFKKWKRKGCKLKHDEWDRTKDPRFDPDENIYLFGMSHVKKMKNMEKRTGKGSSNDPQHVLAVWNNGYEGADWWLYYRYGKNFYNNLMRATEETRGRVGRPGKRKDPHTLAGRKGYHRRGKVGYENYNHWMAKIKAAHPQKYQAFRGR